MLIAARLTERQAPLDQHVNLVETIREVVIDYTPLVIECDRRIEFETTASSVTVRGNRRAIESIVANLIDNALRAEPEDGTVLARVLDDGVAEIIDHGEGVSEADREMIFELFWRKNDATPGTGLGLAIAKERRQAFLRRSRLAERRPELAGRARRATRPIPRSPP